VKFYPTHKNVWNLADREKFPSFKVQGTEYKRCYGSTYLCQSRFWTMDINKSKHVSRLTDARLDNWRKEQHSTLPTLKNWLTKAVWGSIIYSQNVFLIIRLFVLLSAVFCILFAVHIYICPVKKKNNLSYFVSARRSSLTLNETLDAKNLGDHWGTACWPVNLKQRPLWPPRNSCQFKRFILLRPPCRLQKRNQRLQSSLFDKE